MCYLRVKTKLKSDACWQIRRSYNSVPVPEIGEKDDEPTEQATDTMRSVDCDKGLETLIHLPFIHPQGRKEQLWAARGKEAHIIMADTFCRLRVIQKLQ